MQTLEEIDTLKVASSTPPNKKSTFKFKRKEEKKVQLKVAFDHCKYWKFKIHWNKSELLMPTKRDTKKRLPQ